MRKHDRSAMELSGDLALRLLEVTPNAVLVVRTGGRILFANAGVESLLGSRRDQLVGRLFEELLVERCRGAYERHGLCCPDAAEEAHTRLLLHARHSDGRELPVEVASRRLPAPNGALVLSALRDLSTERRLARELEEARTALRRISRLADHDVRQPLQALSLLTSAAARHAHGDSGLCEVVERQRQALDTLARLLTAPFDAGERLPRKRRYATRLRR